MDLKKYQMQDLLLAAIKSEIESNRIYIKIARNVKNGLLKDKLLFLAQEEDKHRHFIEKIYKKKFPKKKIDLPKKTPVPLPALVIPDEETSLSKILATAMQAEYAAVDFYKSLSAQFTDDQTVQNTLLYFADMELQHYKIL